MDFIHYVGFMAGKTTLGSPCDLQTITEKYCSIMELIKMHAILNIGNIYVYIFQISTVWEDVRP
jgi:hypothetical protein